MLNNQRPSLLPLLTVNFVGTMGFSIVLPFLVFLVVDWGGNALVYGIMGATYSFFQLIGAPILGRWSDTYGRKKILFLSQVGTLVSWAVLLAALFLPVITWAKIDAPLLGTFSITLPLVVLFVARAADGITGGNVSVANAYLADLSDEKNRSANFGKMSASANLGFILGPALAGLLGALYPGELLPVLAALLISAVGSALIWFKLEESRPCVMRRDPEPANVRKAMGQEPRPCFELEGRRGLSIWDAMRLPAVGRMLAVYFLVFLGFNFFYISFPVHVATTMGWTVAGTGIYFSVLGFLMAMVQGPVLSRASARWGDRTLLLWGALILGGGFVCNTVPAYAGFYAGAVLIALGNGLMWPSVMSLLAKAAGGERQGAVQGIAGSLGAVASILGLLVGGLLYDSIGDRVFFLSAVMVVFAFAAMAVSRPIEGKSLPAWVLD